MSAAIRAIRAAILHPADLEDLSRSIRQHGIVQPVVVRTRLTGRYEIIAGERRWRASQMAGLVEIPVIVRDVDDKTALEIAIVENVQRADLNPLEEAQGYEQLIAQYGYTQNDLGEVIGKSRSHVANSLRLLKLPDEVRPCCPKVPCRPVMPGPLFRHPIRWRWPN
jgi:ParB family chromosome partitioning protein